MKNLVFIFGGLVVIMLLAANVTKYEQSSFVMTVVGEEPVLPDVPYNYADIVIPDHLTADFSDSTDLGYGRGAPVDPLIFDDLDDHKVTLGRVLFYDKKLSAVENISCGSCHKQELSFAENKDFSEGVSTNTSRNSMHLNDLGWSNSDHFTWDMEHKDLHEMIILPLTDVNEIGANIDDVRQKLSLTTYYPSLFVNAYGNAEITEERIVNALVQFIRSMTTFESRLDKSVEIQFADFTQQELLGKEIFESSCTHCHSQGSHTFFGGPILFQGEDILEIFPFIFNNGLPEDPDDMGAGEWQLGFEHLFKLPTLRNVELTGPYMHDGRFNTLEDVVDHYSEGIEPNNWTGLFLPQEGFNFNEEEKKALVAFLKTLTDESFLVNPKWSDPFGQSSSTNNLVINNITLMPNPMSDRAMIKYQNDDNHLVSISIRTQDGKLVRHDKTTSDYYELDKGDFFPGVYFVSIIMGDKQATQKLIVN